MRVGKPLVAPLASVFRPLCSTLGSPGGHSLSRSFPLALSPMSKAAYERVATDAIELQPAQPDDTQTSTFDAYTGQSERQPLTKRTIYSSHRVEARTPRLDGETDAAFKRRVTTSHLTAIAHSIGWVLAAIGILYYTDIWNVIRYDYRVNQSVKHTQQTI